MKIAFLCFSLEPGRDGVGDYTLRLVKELIGIGHHVYLIALKDRWIDELILETTGTSDSAYTILRIPSLWDEKKQFRIAKEHINKFDPDWISLQYVIFGFHPKGLPFGLSKKLKWLGAGR